MLLAGFLGSKESQDQLQAVFGSRDSQLLEEQQSPAEVVWSHPSLDCKHSFPIYSLKCNDEENTKTLSMKQKLLF